jgi:integrase/recombinase XerD
MAIPFLLYEPAELRANKNWFIEFKVTDPVTGTLVRRMRRVKPMKSRAQRKQLAEVMRISINEKLAQGWNPLIHGDNVKGMDSLDDIGALYLRHKKDLAPRTLESYTSFLAMASAFMEMKYMRPLRINEWNKRTAVTYLNWIRMERENSVRTHNNHLLFFKGLWNWMISYEYAHEHPFKGIPKEKVRLKRRLVVPEEMRQRIGSYFHGHNKAMHLTCLLIYGAGMRPAEIVRLRVSDVDLLHGCIHLGDHMTKTMVMRSPTMPDYLLLAMKEYLEGSTEREAYLLSKAWEPGTLPMDPERLGEAWYRMREKLGIEREYQLYSLRDSGIENLFEQGIDAKTIMHQFGHKNLATTTKYAVRPNPKTLVEIKRSGGGF